MRIIDNPKERNSSMVDEVTKMLCREKTSLITQVTVNN